MSIVRAFLYTVTLICSGCLAFIVPKVTNPELKGLLELPTREQMYEKFNHFSFEKQLDIYFAAASQTHPPDKTFAYKIAEQYKNIIPFLIEIIKMEKDEASLSQTSINRKWEIKSRKKDIFYLINSIIHTHKCSLHLSLEQINFLIEETPFIIEGDSFLVEKNSTIYSKYKCATMLNNELINLLLQCSQPKS